jgi:hypothetical protein
MLSRDGPDDRVRALANSGDIVDDLAPLLHQPKIADRYLRDFAGQFGGVPYAVLNPTH